MSKPITNEALLRSVQQTGLAMTSESVVNLDIRNLFPHPQNDVVYSSAVDQIRIQELADNIELHGQIDALVVMKHPDADKVGMYMIISGHRRWNALKMLAFDRNLVVFEKARCVIRSFGSYEESVLFLISCNSTQRQLSDYSIYMQAQTAIQTIEKMRLNNDPMVRGKRSAMILSEMMSIGDRVSKTIMSLEDTLGERLMGEFKDSTLTFNMVSEIRRLDDSSKEAVIEKILSGEHTLRFNRQVIHTYSQLKNMTKEVQQDETPDEPVDDRNIAVREPVKVAPTKAQPVEKPLVRKTVTGKVTPVKIREALIRSVNKVRLQVVEDDAIDKNYISKVDAVIKFIEEIIQ